MFANLEKAGHRFACAHAILGRFAKRADIVSKEDAVILRRPFKQLRIGNAGQTDILNADKIDRWSQPQKATTDRVIEVLIRGETHD